MAVAQEAEQVSYQSEGRQIDLSLLKCACRNILGQNIECWAGSNASIGEYVNSRDASTEMWMWMSDSVLIYR